MLSNSELKAAWKAAGIKDFTAGNKVSRIVLSVPHSGTRFARKAFRCLSVHTYLPEAFHIEEDVVICPLRDPKAVWRSWERRIGTGHQVPVSFKKAWMDLAELDLRYDIHYLPLDVPDRDYYFQKILETLGEDIPIDWKPEGHLPDSMAGNVEHPMDLSSIYELPVVSRFYG